jgi:hypothetical protein
MAAAMFDRFGRPGLGRPTLPGTGALLSEVVTPGDDASLPGGHGDAGQVAAVESGG